MNKRLKAILFAVMLIAAAMLVTSCSGTDDDSYYNSYDKDGYNVSIKFDANGGEFTTSTSSIVDTYKLEELPTGADGKKSLMLITPDNPLRGKSNTFSVNRSDYFFAGWYQEKTLLLEGEDGNDIYSYSGKWDFSKPYSLDASKDYSASEPIITLYAAWIPRFTVDYYDRATDELLCTYTVLDPTKNKEVLLPTWNDSTGKMDYNSLAAGETFGYTFSKAYFDKEGTQPIEGNSFEHIGSVLESNATATLSNMKVYVDRIEGTWYRISNAEQLIKNAGTMSNYEILCDIDFSGFMWPEVLSKNIFNGTFRSENGATIKNVTIEQNNVSQLNFGLFGQVGSSAIIENISFENTSVTITSGTNKTPARFGLFAGEISDDAVITNVSISGKLSVNSDFAPGTIPGGTPTNCLINLLGLNGDEKNISYENITFEVIEGTDFDLTLTQDGNNIVYSQKPKAKAEETA